MSDSKKLLRGSVVLTVGRVGSYGLSFARNVILARMLTKADFGLASLFAMTVTLLELAARMSFGQQLIQSKEGDSEPFQATSHAFQFILGLCGGLLILAFSYPLAYAFKIPHCAWAFATMAVVPIARGFEHLDYYRQQRELNYIPATLCELIPQAIITLAAWPLAIWLGDFRTIVWLLLGKAVIGIIVTHVMAKRAYRWAWHSGHVRKMWSFGWPLLLNGLLMFGCQQADQALVGALLSLEALAMYCLAFSLVSVPWFIFAQVGSSVMLPMMSKAQDDPARFRHQYRNCVECAAVLGVVLVTPFVVAGDQFVTFVYGSKYLGTGPIIAILGSAFAIRFLRFAPAIAAMARADTVNQLYSNLWRGISLPLVICVAILGADLLLIAWCSLIAELVAAGVSLLRLRQRQGIPLRDSLNALLYVGGLVGGALVFMYSGSATMGHFTVSLGVLAFLALSIWIAWIVLPGVGRMIGILWRRERFLGA